MLHDVITLMSSVGTTYIFLIVILFAFTENIFPPSPSDVIVVVGASVLAFKGAFDFLSLLILASLASSGGFMLVYWIGDKLGERLIRTGKLKFIKQEDFDKVNVWFNKYGYILILVNRFLPGTRSAISFFTGLHKLEPIKTFVFATISAFLWNVFLFLLGYFLGKNVEAIDYYLKTYSSIIFLITIVVILLFVVVKFFKKRKAIENQY